MKSEGRGRAFSAENGADFGRNYIALSPRTEGGGRCENEMARISPRRMGIALGTQQSKAEHGGAAAAALRVSRPADRSTVLQTPDHGAR